MRSPSTSTGTSCARTSCRYGLKPATRSSARTSRSLRNGLASTAATGLPSFAGGAGTKGKDPPSRRGASATGRRNRHPRRPNLLQKRQLCGGGAEAEPPGLQPPGHFPHPTSSNMSAAVLEQRPQILARAAQGDLDSFSQLIDPLLDPAYRLAAVMLGDRSAAEDAGQEASIKAWRKLRQLRGDAQSLRAWFLSIVANECRMAARTRWFSVIRVADVPAQAPDDRESHSDLRRALMRLTPDERLPLVLHFYLDLPLDEVARTLRVSPSAAKSRIYRAAKRLRADLTIEEVF